jgi:alkaline phosphatase
MKPRAKIVIAAVALLFAATSAVAQLKAKYVFLFIGDGMSLAQVNAAEVYAKALEGKEPGIKKLGFTQFTVSGITTTYDSSSIITDSASAVTAIATGNKTLSGVINMDTAKKAKYKTVAEYARDAGMKVGVVSSVSIDHATPAGFFAKVPSRGDMYDICLQMVDSGFDYFGGGGLAQPKGKDGSKPDAYELLKAKGYKVVSDPADIKALKPGQKAYAYGARLQDSAALPYDIDREPGELELADYVAKGIELLENPNGFFFAIESGKIDWACHANDAAASIGDTLAFDRAIGKAVEFYKKYPRDTLIVVTGDHETGGMSIGFAGTQYSTFFDKVAKQKGSYVKFNDEIVAPFKEAYAAKTASYEDILPVALDYFGIDAAKLSDSEKELLERAFVRSMKGEVERAPQENVFLLYGGYEPFTVKLSHIANAAAGIGWTSYSHTGVPVPTYARGVGYNLFDGYYDNTELFGKLMRCMGLKK